MWRFVPFIFVAMLPASVSALELSLLLESQQVPLYGAACGVLVIANDSNVAMVIDVPSTGTGSLIFELKREGSVIRIAEEDGLVYSSRYQLTMNPDSSIHLPFYLLKNRSYFWGELGSCELRACLESGSPRTKFTSAWVQVEVIPDAKAEDWKRLNDPLVRICAPFDLPSVPFVKEHFSGTAYFHTYLIYQAFNPGFLTSPDAMERVLERRQQIDDELNRSGVGREMWDAFAMGKCGATDQKISGARYLLCH